jgi:hypothetical protein
MSLSRHFTAVSERERKLCLMNDNGDLKAWIFTDRSFINDVVTVVYLTQIEKFGRKILKIC